MQASLFASLALQILRWRWLLLALAGVLTAFFASQLHRLQLDTSNEGWLIEGDESLRLIRKFNALFGNDDFVYVLFDAGDFFRPEPIERLAGLADLLAERVPHLVDLTWLGNAEYIEGREESIEIEELMAALPRGDAELARVRRRALSEPSYVDDLISRDGRVAGVLLEMDAYPGDRVDPRKDIAPALRTELARPAHADLDLVAVGGPILDYDLDVITAGEARDLGLLCLAVQMAILLWVGRGARGVLVPAAVVTLSVVWTFGLVALLGFEVNASVTMVPVLLICVGIGDSMHVIAAFHDQRRRGLPRREAITRALGDVGWPCLLTSLTTAVGFLAFVTTPLAPFREMGIYAAAGVAMAMALSFVLVPALYSWGPDAPAPPEPGQRDVFDRLLAAIARLVARRPRALVAAFSALGLLALAGYARLEIETNPIEMFSEDVPIRRAFERVDAHMGGSMSVEIMLDTGRRDGILDPVFLRAMNDLDRFVRDHELTTKTTSVLDILRQMRRAFHENRHEYYDIPSSRQEAAQYLLLYEMSGGDNQVKLIPFDRDVARLTARTRSLGTGDVKRFFADVQDFALRRFDGIARVEPTGMLSWARAMVDLVAEGQRKSFGAAMAVIAVLMMTVLRSVRLGLVSMIPNLFPIVVSLGLFGLSGRSMDVMTMGFSALAIGVVVDDTIHFFVRYRREFARLGRYAPALEATLASVGRPITFTTLTLSLGFAVLGASDVVGLAWFGILAAVTFVWALLADFLFAPALLLLLRPLGPERARHPGTAPAARG